MLKRLKEQTQEMCENRNLDEVRNEINANLTHFQCDKPDLRTSKVYQTFNLPHRFECPCKLSEVGNFVLSSQQLLIFLSDLFQGYGAQKPNQNPFYKTVNSEYGWFAPNPHTVPLRFFPRSQDFSTNLARSGMYRNYSLNTAMDKTFY